MNISKLRPKQKKILYHHWKFFTIKTVTPCIQGYSTFSHENIVGDRKGFQIFKFSAEIRVLSETYLLEYLSDTLTFFNNSFFDIFVWIRTSRSEMDDFFYYLSNFLYNGPDVNQL